MNELIKELENKRKNYEDCFSAEEAKLIREWNKAIDECINVVINMYENYST